MVFRPQAAVIHFQRSFFSSYTVTASKTQLAVEQVEEEREEPLSPGGMNDCWEGVFLLKPNKSCMEGTRTKRSFLTCHEKDSESDS